MALLDIFRNFGEKMGKGMERNIGGLLGIDPEDMTEAEKKQARRLSQMAVFDALARGTTPTAGLQGAATLLGAQREERALKGRQKAAEDEIGRITGRLFGGAPAAPADMGEDEAGLGTVAIQSQYRQNPQEALARMYGTSAGRDVAQMAPGLLELAQEGVKGRTVGGAVYNPLTGEFTKPPQEKKPRLPVREVDSGREKIVYFDDGTVERIPKTLAPGAGGAGAGGKQVKPSEGQIRSSLLAKGMRDAEQELFNLSPSSVIGRGAGFVPEAFKSGDRKRYESAAKRWAANLLYIKSGAQAGQDEINSTWQQFFPVPGDSQEEIAQKNRARIQELEAVSGMLGTVGFKTDEFQPKFVKEKPAEISLDDWMIMTPKDRADFLKAGKRK